MNRKKGEELEMNEFSNELLQRDEAFSGRLEQYIGRLNRDYDGKTEVIVYDYVDSHIRDLVV